MEVRGILRADPTASGTVYGTHYVIRSTHQEMLPTPLLFAEAVGAIAHVDIREHNPFASRSTATSPINLPTLGQAGCDTEGDPPRATGSLLRDPRKVPKSVVAGQVSSSTEPPGWATKKKSMATQRDASAGQRSSSPRAPYNCLNSLISPNSRPLHSSRFSN